LEFLQSDFVVNVPIANSKEVVAITYSCASMLLPDGTTDAIGGIDMKHNSSYIAVVLALFTLVEGYAQQPFIGVEAGSDTLHWYMGTPVEIPILVAPALGVVSVSGNATITPIDIEMGRYRATISNPEAGLNEVCVTVEGDGRRASQCIPVVVAQPEMTTGIDGWSGMRAMIGRKYNPSSEWKNLAIPAAHYQTVVEIDGRIVFDRFGTSFRERDLPDHMVVTEKMKEIRATVFWKPNGTADRALWVALATNSGPSSRHRCEIAYPAPEQTEGFEFDWQISPRSLKAEFGPIVLVQNLGEGKQVGVKPTISCDECADFGIGPYLVQRHETHWELLMSVDLLRLKPTINGKRFQITLLLNGRGGVTGFGFVEVTVWNDPGLFSPGSIPLDSAEWSDDGFFASRPTREPWFDSEPGEMIQALKPFRGKKIAVFSIEREFRDTIVRHMEEEDRGDIERLQAMCQAIHEVPLADCFSTMLKIASSRRTGNGKNYQAFKLLVAQQYSIDPDDIDDTELMKMLRIVLAVKGRREARPDKFYLVTSQEKRPRILGLVSTDNGGPFGGPAVRETFAGSTLSRELKSLGSWATKELPAMLPSAMDDQESALVRVWPQGKVTEP
jgi:hypothetical protein